jgi:hypothetical protein
MKREGKTLRTIEQIEESFRFLIIDNPVMQNIKSEMVEIRKALNDAEFTLREVLRMQPQYKVDENIPDDKESAYGLGYEDALTDVIHFIKEMYFKKINQMP